MNKVRQAAITREIIEVVSGAQALVRAMGSGRARALGRVGEPNARPEKAREYGN